MLSRRIIPCLDVRNGRVVKGINFSGLRDAGDPAELAARYESDGADELTLLDVSATTESRPAAIACIENVRRVLGIPLTVGGGIRSVSDASRLLDAGADKVAVNSAAVERPGLIAECAEKFGTQCIVVAIDARRSETSWEVVVRSGSARSGKDAVRWASEAQSLGAGEVLLTSWDRDGTGSGYDLELTGTVARAVTIPLIASGGAAGPDDLFQALKCGADAVLAASIFHDQQFSILEVKSFLRQHAVEVRL